MDFRVLNVIPSMVLSTAFFLAGCAGAIDGNDRITVHNDTDQRILIQYTEYVNYDLSITSPAVEFVDPGDSVTVAPRDTLFDAEIFVTYSGIKRRYDLDPNFFGFDEIRIVTSDFESNPEEKD